LASPKLVRSQDTETLNVQLSEPNKPGKLNISLIFGSIKVVSHAGNEVIITATAVNDKNKKSKSVESPTTGGTRKLSSGDGFELNVNQKNNKIDVHIDKPNLRVNITAKVPKNFSLELHTINNGDIEVQNVDGNHEISNINGAVTMTDIDGSVVANTVNGPLKVSFNSVASNTPMAFSTVNGLVDVTFPANLKGNMKLKSTFGDVFTDFDIVENKEGKIKTSADNEKGVYKISKDDFIQGKINGGGPEIMLKSLNGKIMLRKKK
jgi:hypothetical protein